MAVFVSNSWAAEYIEFKSYDTRLQINTEVLAEVHFPKYGSAPYPVIITQHGSSPTERFENGKGSTDVFSKSVIKQGLENGFAVVAIDAFYKRGLDGTKKTQFPNATRYAYDLKAILTSDARFDSSKIFYTGWSYGGMMTLDALSGQYNTDPTPWRAVAPSEAGCQFQPPATKLSFPVIFVLGETSHYPPGPCIGYAESLKKQGNTVSTIVIPGANHHYSTYGFGRTKRSYSLNGCTDNPVIKDRSQWRHVDGTPVSREEAWKKCTTWQGGNGGAADKLDESVKYIIDSFNKYK